MKFGFVKNLTFGFLILISSFLLSKNVLAVSNIYQDEGNGSGVKTNFANLSSLSGNSIIFSNTISENCNNSITFVHTDSYTDIPFTSYQYDGVDMVDSGLGAVNGLANLNVYSQVFIIKNASKGTKNVYIHSGNMNSASIAITTFCNVDQDVPFDSSSYSASSNYWEDVFNSSYFNITNDNSFVFFETANRGGNQSESNSGFSFITPFASHNGNNYNLAFGGGIVDKKITTDYYFLHNKVGANPQVVNLRYWVLNYKSAEYCGDNVCQTANENFETCSADCFPGVDYHTQSIITPLFYSYGYLIPGYYQVFKYNYDIFSGVGDGDYITLNRCYAYSSSSATACDYSVPVVFDSGTATSTHWYMGNQTTGSSTASTTSYGLSSFPLSTTDAVNTFGTSTDKTVLYKITPYFHCAYGVCIKGIPEIIPINWKSETNSLIDIASTGLIPSISNTNNSTGVITLFGLDIHKLACSDSRWVNAYATSSSVSSIVGHHLDYPTYLSCSGIEVALTIPAMIESAFETTLNYLIKVVNSLFPFNLIIRVSESWNNASLGVMPADLSFFGMAKDSNNEIGFDVPAEWTGASTTTRIIVFGSSIFVNENSRMALVFAGVRNLSTYFFWFAFIFYCVIGFGWRLIKEIENKDSNNPFIE